MEAIGGGTPKFVQAVAPSEGDAPAGTSVRLEIANPHLVVIGDVLVEVQDGKVHITPSADQLEVILHRDAQ
jgi:hypothetical protein